MIIIRGKRAILELSSSSVKLLVGPSGKARGLGDFTADSTRTQTTKGVRGGIMDIAWYEQNVLPVIMRYKNECDKAGIQEITCTCTAVYRGCSNRDQIFEIINNATGLEPILLSGQEEAGLAPLGFSMTSKTFPGWKLFIDQGRGSTEFTLQDDSGVTKDSVSVFIGNEMLGKATNPQLLAESTIQSNLGIKRILKKAGGLRNIVVVGTGGVLTKSYGLNHLDEVPLSVMKEKKDPLLSTFISICSVLRTDTLVINKADSTIGAWFKYFE